MRTVEGADGQSVRELKRSDLSVLADEAWKAERVLLLASLDESMADQELRLRSLREFDAQRGTIGPLLMATFKIKGCDDIIAFACEKCGMLPQRFCEGLADRDRQRIARELIGVRPAGEPEGGSGTTIADP